MPELSESRRLRRGRVSEKGRAYMVTSTVLDRRNVFADWRVGRLLVAELKAAQEKGLARSMAWVVMPDHFHWLFELRESELSELVRRIKSRTSIAVNRALGGSGGIWQDGFHDRAVRREEDFLPIARYIVANPLRAGLVSNIGDYPLWDCIWLEGSD